MIRSQYADRLFLASTVTSFVTYLLQVAAAILGFWWFGLWRGLALLVLVLVVFPFLRMALGTTFAYFIVRVDPTFFD
jgi:hypothetical protein